MRWREEDGENLRDARAKTVESHVSYWIFCAVMRGKAEELFAKDVCVKISLVFRLVMYRQAY